MEWIIENAQWLFNLAGAGIGGLFLWHKEKKSKALQVKLQAADAKLRELDVDDKHLDLSAKVNAAVKEAVDSILNVKAAEIATLNESYQSQITTLRADLTGVKEDVAEAKKLKIEAGNLADSYKVLIDRLQAYTTYLKSLLDTNGITYKEFEDEH